MPKNTIKTCNCQYVTNGRTCGKPPHFMHATSGKVFCFNHYSRLAIVSSGWVNLQRSDAEQELERLRRVGHAENPSTLSPLHSEDGADTTHSEQSTKSIVSVIGKKFVGIPVNAPVGV